MSTCINIDSNIFSRYLTNLAIYITLIRGRIFNKDVCDLACKSNFIHHHWVVEFRLRLVEQFGGELLELHTDTDRDASTVLM